MIAWMHRCHGQLKIVHTAVLYLSFYHGKNISQFLPITVIHRKHMKLVGLYSICMIKALIRSATVMCSAWRSLALFFVLFLAFVLFCFFAQFQNHTKCYHKVSCSDVFSLEVFGTVFFVFVFFFCFCFVLFFFFGTISESYQILPACLKVFWCFLPAHQGKSNIFYFQLLPFAFYAMKMVEMWLITLRIVEWVALIRFLFGV